MAHMLKTVNTNFRFAGIDHATRPITQNIQQVIEDIAKLQGGPASTKGFVVFPVFPVADNQARRTSQLERYVERVGSAGRLTAQGFVRPASSDGSWGVAWYVVESVTVGHQRTRTSQTGEEH